MPKIDQARIEPSTGSRYPAPFDAPCKARQWLRLGDAAGLTQFGVNLVTLVPGALSSLRHWHLNEDEFVMITQGACVLVRDAGETVMRAGDCAAFPAGNPDGHQFINRTDAVARFLVVGTKAAAEVATYCDHDLMVHQGGGKSRFTHKDGSDWSGPR